MGSKELTLETHLQAGQLQEFQQASLEVVDCFKSFLMFAFTYQKLQGIILYLESHFEL